MKIREKITASEIRTLGLNKETVLSFEYMYTKDDNNQLQDQNFILADGKRILSFKNGYFRTKAYNKIRNMGLGWGWVAPQLTDEEQGIIEASKNGENPFAYSIICSNPKLNGIFK